MAVSNVKSRTRLVNTMTRYRRTFCLRATGSGGQCRLRRPSEAALVSGQTICRSRKHHASHRFEDRLVETAAQVLLPDEMHASRRIPDERSEEPANLAAQKKIPCQPCEENTPRGFRVRRPACQHRQQAHITHDAGGGDAKSDCELHESIFRRGETCHSS